MKPIVISSLVAALIALHGCSGANGPKTMRVRGDVSIDGKPIEDGTIDFVSEDGSPPAQGPIKAGHFDLPPQSGPLVEKTYRVEINALRKTGKTVPDVMGDGSATMDELENIIPPMYNARSTLKATISPDASKNQFDFKLDSAAASRSR